MKERDPDYAERSSVVPLASTKFGRETSASVSMPEYPHLFSPLPLGPRVAKNRVWMTAHGTQLVKAHTFTEEHVAYYAERAAGGVGVITLEAMAVHPTTQPYSGKVFAFDPAVIPSYRRIAESVHDHGCLVLAQPWHRGRETTGKVSRLPIWAPSSIPCTVYREMPHVMRPREIEELVDGYMLAARYAAEGGLDGVEVHGLAHGYLLGQFLSPATNHRQDAYGGDFDRRLRLVMDILRRTRDEVGNGLIVGVRINGDDGVEGGLGPEEWSRIARAITDTGLVDYVSVSQGTYMDRSRIYGGVPNERGYQLEVTAKIKVAVGHVPVVAVGRLTTPELAEWVIATGKADFAGMTRTLIADPQWATKAATGKTRDIRPCVGANWCMAAIVNSPLACVHNPAVGRERELGDETLQTAVTPRRVAVVGGGPAGLRAAYTAARRGHDVVLFERDHDLGGQVRLIAKAATYREWQGIIDWLADQLSHLPNVDIRTGITPGPAQLLTGGFGAVVVATGSSPIMHGWSSLHPAEWSGERVIPGVEQWNVLSVHDVLAGGAPLGPNVMIFDDTGTRHAVVVAEYLAERRHVVEIVTTLAQVAPDLEATRDLQSVYRRLRRAGVRFTTNTDLVEIDGDRVELRDVWTGDSLWREPVDALVLSTGSRANDLLVDELAGTIEVCSIGDCVAPRTIFNAIWEGEMAARTL